MDDRDLETISRELYESASQAELESDRWIGQHTREVFEATYRINGIRSKFIVAEHANLGPGWALYDIQTEHPYRVVGDRQLTNFKPEGC